MFVNRSESRSLSTEVIRSISQSFDGIFDDAVCSVTSQKIVMEDISLRILMLLMYQTPL